MSTDTQTFAMSILAETEPRTERSTADGPGGVTPHQFTFWPTKTGELRGVRPAAAAPGPSVADTATLPLPFGDGDAAGREGV